MARGPNRRRVDGDPEAARRVWLRVASLVLPSAAAVILFGAGAWFAWQSLVVGDALRVHAITFEGTARAAREELLELAPLQRGDHLLLVDVAAVEAALRRHPWVKSADVRRQLPHDVAITIVERRPAALVELGGLYLVDAEGEVFKRAAPGDGLDLPVVTGIAREDWLERRAEAEGLITAALAFLERWRSRGLEARAAVSELHVDAALGTTLWTGDGAEIRLGQGDVEEKLSRLARVLQALDAEGQRAEVLHLDNRRRPDWVAVKVAARRAKGQPEEAGP